MNDQMKTKKPLWRQIVRGLVITAVGLFALALVVRSVWGYIAARQLHAEIAGIRAAGEPLTFDELEATLPKVDPKDDAARLYTAAMALTGGEDLGEDLTELLSAYREASKSWPVQQLDSEMLERVQQMLADNQRAFDLFDEAGDLPACDYDICIRHGISQALKHLSRSRAAVQFLSLRTRHSAFQGEGDAAADSVISSLKTARMLDREPVLIAYLTRVCTTTVACQNIPTVLELGDPSDAALLRLQMALREADRPELFSRVTLAERVYGVLTMRSAVTSGMGIRWPEDETTEFPEQIPVGFWNRPLMQSMAAGYLRDMGKVVRASRKPWPNVLDARNNLEGDSLLGRISLPSLTRAACLAGRSLAGVRSAQVAVMIERYRRAHNELPASLSDLTPTYAESLPLDPFTGKELIYGIEESGYLIYSVGDDGQDDGGNLERKDDQKPTDYGLRIRHLNSVPVGVNRSWPVGEGEASKSL